MQSKFIFMKIKRIKWFITFASALALLLCLQVDVLADEAVLTVDTSLNVRNQDAETTVDVASQEPIPEPWVWRPVSVTHEEVNGFNSIRKTYALPPEVNPAVIPTDHITLLGQIFTFGYMIQQPTVNDSYIEVRQTVTIETTTSALNDILPNLEREMGFERDGYAGVLLLDIHSIRSESAGTARRNTIVTRRRTYPHLSSQCNSLIPATIVDGGITLYLASVDWQAGSSSLVDGLPMASTFTAHATYTAAITQTSTIGYVTNADYIGRVSRTVQGKTMYTVVFFATTIVETQLIGTEGSTGAGPDSTNTVLHENGTAIGNNEASTGTADNVSATRPTGDSSRLTGLIVILLILAAVAAGVFFLLKHVLSRNVTIFSIHGPREIVKSGKIIMDVSSHEPEVNLDKVVGGSPSKTGRYLIHITGKAIQKIAGKNIRIKLRDMEERIHIPSGIPYEPLYEHEVNFSDED